MSMQEKYNDLLQRYHHILDLIEPNFVNDDKVLDLKAYVPFAAKYFADYKSPDEDDAIQKIFNDHFFKILEQETRGALKAAFYATHPFVAMNRLNVGQGLFKNCETAGDIDTESITREFQILQKPKDKAEIVRASCQSLGDSIDAFITEIELMLARFAVQWDSLSTQQVKAMKMSVVGKLGMLNDFMGQLSIDMNAPALRADR